MLLFLQQHPISPPTQISNSIKVSSQINSIILVTLKKRKKKKVLFIYAQQKQKLSYFFFQQKACWLTSSSISKLGCTILPVNSCQFPCPCFLMEPHHQPWTFPNNRPQFPLTTITKQRNFYREKKRERERERSIYLSLLTEVVPVSSQCATHWFCSILWSHSLCIEQWRLQQQPLMKVYTSAFHIPLDTAPPWRRRAGPASKREREKKKKTLKCNLSCCIYVASSFCLFLPLYQIVQLWETSSWRHKVLEQTDWTVRYLSSTSPAKTIRKKIILVFREFCKTL